MPTVGLGSSGGCHPDPIGQESCGKACGCEIYDTATSAIKLGYRAFHDALSYGNQAGLGSAIRDAETKLGIPRREFFVMSMVPKFLMGYNETKRSVAASLEQLQVDYIDLMMVHHRAADNADWPRLGAAMKAFAAGSVSPGNPSINGTKAIWLPPPCALIDPTWIRC